MKTFEIGQIYSMISPCMHDCIWSYTVTKRTSQTVTITDGKETKTYRISKPYSQFNNAETIFPLGHYSMCPILRADRTC